MPQGRRLVRRSRKLGATALIVAGVSALAACAGSNAATASHSIPAESTRGAAADGLSALSLSPPAVIGHAVAKGVQPTATAKRATPMATARPGTAGTGEQLSTPGAGSQSGSQDIPDPSGENPLTALSGFILKYVQDFNGDSIPPNWGTYNGVPGGESSTVAQWVPGMCTFSGGEAHFMAMGIDSCGLQYYGGSQKYGAWFARLKGDSEPSSMWFSNIFLLWPDNDQWPPEIDIYEDSGGSRSSTSASMFNTVGDVCGSSPTSQCLEPYEQSNGQSGGVSNNGTQWSTYGVEWTPSGVTWLVDGRVIYTAPASQVKSPAQQPALPMGMDLQSQNLQGAGTPTQRETMTVDWVDEYTWNG
jgi:hypothetical protein